MKNTKAQIKKEKHPFKKAIKFLKLKLYNILENPTSPQKQVYDVFALFVVITSSISIIVDFIPNIQSKIPPDLKQFLDVYEEFSLWFFVLEYILRWWVISNFAFDFQKEFFRDISRPLAIRIFKGIVAGFKPKIKWMLSFYAIIDLLAILPIFRPFRAFRILRVLRILKIIRYGGALKSLYFALKEQGFLFVFIFLTIITWIVSISLIVYIIEYNAGNKLFSSMWYAIYWGIVTISTVGFGDIVPITSEGRFLTAVMIGGGIILVSALTGTFSAALVSRLSSIKGGDIKLENLENHIVICGWNETAEEIVEQLMEMDLDKEKGIVIITNIPKEDIGIKLPDYIGYKKGDFIHDSILLDVSVDKASDIIIVAEREQGLSERNIDARTALAAMVVSNINPNANIYVEVLLDEDAEIFKRRMRVKEVLIHGQLIGKILLSSILNPGSAHLLKTLIDKETGIQKLKVKDIGSFETFGELLIAVRNKNYLAIAVERKERLYLSPADTFYLEQDDYVFLVPSSVS